MGNEVAIREDKGYEPILAADPSYELGQAKAAAGALKEVLGPWEVNLGGKSPHVQVEGWQTVAAMTGHAVLPQAPEIVPEIEPDRGVYAWRCTATVVDRNGKTVGQGTAVCDPRENPRGWGKSNHSCQGMAETRASGRALRSRLAYIVGLSGYAPTPAEDIPGSEQNVEEARKVTARERYKILRRMASEDVLREHLGDDGPKLWDDEFFAGLAMRLAMGPEEPSAVAAAPPEVEEAASMLKDVKAAAAQSARELLLRVIEPTGPVADAMSDDDPEGEPLEGEVIEGQETIDDGGVEF